jgi:hypothetical protein
MANRIVLKKSSIAGKIPLATDLEYGELALNYTDGRLYYKNANNTVGQIGGAAGGGSSSLRIYQRGDLLQEDAVVVGTTSGTLAVGVRTSTNPIGSVGVLV